MKTQNEQQAYQKFKSFVTGLTCDWFCACSTPFGEEFPKALGTIGLVLPARESLASQGPGFVSYFLFFSSLNPSSFSSTPLPHLTLSLICLLGAVGASETLSVPGIVSVSHSTSCDHLELYWTTFSSISCIT